MVGKGLDTTFIHYGIRKEDISLIETLCTAHKLDFTWVCDDILREYHDKKVSNQAIDEKVVERIIEKAIQKIR